MKHFRNMIAFVAPILLAATACDNSEYELNRLVPEKYHKMSSFKGKSDDIVKLFDIDESSKMHFTVLRTGSNPDETAQVDLVSMTQEELSSYNANYVLVDPAYYTVEKSLTFESGEAFKNMTAVFSAQAVQQLKAMTKDLKPGQIYCVALKLSDTGNCQVNKDHGYILRKVMITKPGLHIRSAQAVAEGSRWWVDRRTNSEVELEVTMDTDNIWDFDCTVSYDPALIDAYNAANGTSFEKLDGVKVEAGKVEFVKGQNSCKVPAKLKIPVNKFGGLTQYLVPVEVKHDLFEGRIFYIVVEDKIPLRVDMLSAPFAAVTYDGQWFDALVDDNPSTYWHSPWRDPKYLPQDEYGHWFQIKLDKPLNKEMCYKYWSRNATNTLPLTIKMMASTDQGKSWKTVHEQDGDLPGRASHWTSPIFNVPSGVTDLRFCIIRVNNNGTPQRLGFDSSASTCLAGFRVWGY